MKKSLNSEVCPLFKASLISSKNNLIKSDISFCLNCGNLVFKYFTNSELANYFSSLSLSFLEPGKLNALLKISFSLAPEVLASLPNFLIKDFSSSI